jgi:hypothetical protein
VFQKTVSDDYLKPKMEVAAPPKKSQKSKLPGGLYSKWPYIVSKVKDGEKEGSWLWRMLDSARRSTSTPGIPCRLLGLAIFWRRATLRRRRRKRRRRNEERSTYI